MILRGWKILVGLAALAALVLGIWDFFGPGRTHRQTMRDAAAHTQVSQAEAAAARAAAAKADALRITLDDRSRPIQAAAKDILRAAPQVEAQIRALPDSVGALALVHHSVDLAQLTLDQEADRAQQEAAAEASINHFQVALAEAQAANAILKVEAAKPRLTAPKVIGLIALGAVLGWGAVALF